MSLEDDELLGDFRPQLLLAKQFFLNAEDADSAGGQLNRMIAVHNLHIATEIILKAVASRFDVTLPKDSNIEYSALVAALARSEELRNVNLKLYYRQQLVDLNSQRNLVQHSALDPGEYAVIDHIRSTRRFLVKSFKIYFATDFDLFYESSLIDSEVCRLRLMAAEIHLSKEQFFEAAGYAHAAFDWARKCLPTQERGFSMSGEWVDVRHIKANTSNEDLRFFLKHFEKQNEHMKGQQHALLAVLCGLEPHKYVKFDSLTPRVNYTMGGGVHIWDGDHRRGTTDQEKADFTIRFAAETIVKWQRLGYNLTGERDVDRATRYIKKHIECLAMTEIE